MAPGARAPHSGGGDDRANTTSPHPSLPPHPTPPHPTPPQHFSRPSLNPTLPPSRYQNQELKQALYESEQEALQRDYEEFKQPDANGDDVISRNEVS